MLEIISDFSHRVVIRYLCPKGLTPEEIHEDMVVTLGENGSSHSKVKKWDANSNVAVIV